MMSRDELLAANQLDEFLAQRGYRVSGGNKSGKRFTNACPRTIHGEKHLCVEIDVVQQLFHCHDCGVGGTIIDWLMIENKQTAAQVMKSLASAAPEAANVSSVATKVSAIYDYLNESREMVYQIVRYEPKTFRQRHSDGRGGWIWSMDGVTRVLYNLPDVLASRAVVICEGEKDCLTAGRFGLVATCNVGGAGKWLEAYSTVLTGKDIIIFPDNDTAGRKHAEDVLRSVSDVANSVKVVVIPAPHKDLTEFVDSFPGQEQAIHALTTIIDRTAHTVKPAPLYSLQEMEQQYREQLQRQSDHRFSLTNFLPSLGELIHPMVPGEMLLVVADTGVGKTMLLQNMVRAAAPLPCLLFELELPMSLVFERFVQMEIGCVRSQVQEEYRIQTAPLHFAYPGLQHITVCPESGLTVDQIEKYILRSELKIGQRPVVVAVDYVGLIQHLGSRSRYESMSNIAEQLKVVAKRTNVIMLIASQKSRPDKTKKEESLTVSLHDSKDSGSLENSAGIVLGAWRPERTRMMIKILKNTSGTSGETVEAIVEGATMRITGQHL
jgi:hypothetical protein